MFNEVAKTVVINSPPVGKILRQRRNACIQAFGLFRRYFIRKKRQWFSVLLFDFVVPIIIICLVLYATISNHYDWVNSCQHSPPAGNNETTTNRTVTQPEIYPEPETPDPTPSGDQEPTTPETSVSDSLEPNQSSVDDQLTLQPTTNNGPELILDTGQLMLKQSKELTVDFDLYNELALAVALWSIYLAHFCRGVHFLIDDKITGRRFLLYIHGLMKKPYFVAHYILLTIVPMLITILLVIVMCSVVSPDYLFINLLTFTCFTFHTIALQFFLASLCRSNVVGTTLSLIVWTGHLFLILAVKFLLAGKEGDKTLRYALQIITCILPEQMVVYIYMNDRKLSTGWDSQVHLRSCNYSRKRSYLWQIDNEAIVNNTDLIDSTTFVNNTDLTERTAFLNNTNPNDVTHTDSDNLKYFQMEDKYLLLCSFIWTLVLLLLAYVFDDFSQSKASEGYRSSYNCCTFRSSLKTYRWDPNKPSMIKDSFASLTSLKSGEHGLDEAGGSNVGFNTTFRGPNKRYFENIDLKHERYLGIYLDHVSKQLNPSKGNLFSFSDNEKTIVDGVSFNVYKGQVTLLLGHNGAGKTTIMNMIVGKMRPSAGKVYVNGLDVGQYNNEARFEMSMCPQESIIEDNLTVYEQMVLMAQIKQGIAINNDNETLVQTINLEHMRQHIVAIASELGLREQLGKCAGKLSGGARRKLSLAMAFVGDSSILVLDEPSSGLDPESRKVIWDAIKRRKLNRTLLISTQHMEEADYLGDRVAIMNQGKITCCGSAVFLKRVLGSGNKLRLALMPNANRNLAMHLVHEFFPLAIDLFKDNQGSLRQSVDGSIKWRDEKIINDMLIELKTSQKTEVEDEDGLIRLFEKLETSSEAYGIKSFSLHGSTVEDVLLNSAKIASNNEDPTGHDAATMGGGILNETVINTKLFSLIRASGRDVQQKDLRQMTVNNSHLSFIWALMVKTFLLMIRNIYSTTVWRLFVPFIIFLYTFYTLRHTGEKYIVRRGINGRAFKKDAPLASFIYFESYAVLSRLFGFFAFIHCIIVLTEERKSKFKLILLNSRANVFNYWFAQYLVDTVLIIVYLVMIFIYLNIAGDTIADIYPGVNNTKPQQSLTYGFDTIIRYGIWAQLLVLLITFLFCSSILLICYILSLICSGPISSCISMMLVFFVGYATDLIVIFYKDLDILWSVEDKSDRNERLFNIIHYIVPSETYHLNLAYLLDICLQNDINKSDTKQTKLAHLFSTDGLLIPILTQVSQLFFLALFLLIVEYCDLVAYFAHLYDSFFYTINSKNHSVKIIDDGVERERYKAYSLSKLIERRSLDKKNHSVAEKASLDNTGIVVHEALKVYGSGVRAVDDASFVVARNEIFGLLGVNGAGKTSIFGLLSSDIKPDGGKLFASYYNIVKRASKSRRLCGYDPQAELSFDLTLMEALYLMATLRGITNRKQTIAAIQSCLDLLDLHTHSDTLFHKLSTGTRKKLALALAWIGSPPILLLDEPTTGIDPLTRRNIWKSLTLMKIRAQQSIVIASNAMEECEAICDRLSIISRGQIRCLGTVQNLSDRFNQGYLLRLQFDSVKAPKTRLTAKHLIETVNERLKKQIPSLIVDDTSVDSAAYKITDTRMPRSYILKILRQTRADFNGCISYMLSDATLDDVFLALAREQEKGDKILSSTKSRSNSRKRLMKRPPRKIGPQLLSKTNPHTDRRSSKISLSKKTITEISK